jgi:CheY-like chemotaxis protein
MFIHVVADNPAKLAVVRAALERQHELTSELLDGPSVQRGQCHALVVNVDLRTFENVAALKKKIASLGHMRKRVFILHQTIYLSIAQAYALGATRVLTGPLNQDELLSALADRMGPGAPATAATNNEAGAASVGATAIASMFAAVANGVSIDVEGTKSAGDKITDHIAEKGLSDWLAIVRRHHEGTYQHCLWSRE